MTCAGCQAKVQSLLSNIENVSNVDIDLQNSKADISMSSHIPTAILQAALAAYPKYQLSEMPHQHTNTMVDDAEENKPFFATYKPVLLIFGYVGLLSLLLASLSGTFDAMLAMRVFMSGFFLVFSFFKMLDLGGFADSYATYDIIAKKVRVWGYVYAFIELLLGLAYAVNFMPVITGSVTLVAMLISIIGVLQSVLNKRKIRCACLGAVFNLPMSTITIIEDALMIVMSAAMLLLMV